MEFRSKVWRPKASADIGCLAAIRRMRKSHDNRERFEQYDELFSRQVPSRNRSSDPKALSIASLNKFDGSPV